MRSRTARRLVSGSILIGLLACAAARAQQPRIAVIIDDVGNQLDAGRRSIDLPGSVALAILAHTPFTPVLAQEGRQIIVHMPMLASDHESQRRSYAESIGYAPTSDFFATRGMH